MKRIKRYPAAALALLLMVLLVIGWGTVTRRSWDNLHRSRMVFPDGYERAAGAYGVMNEGPALTLPAGMYTIDWEIETDGLGAIIIETTNGAAVSPQRMTITPEQTSGRFTFEALDLLYNLQILVDFESGGFLRVNRIDLTGCAQADGVITCFFVLAAVALLDILRGRGFLTPRRRGELIILAFTVLIASTPALKANLNGGHDGSFHVDRLLNLLNALRSGQFPARVGAYMQNRYGAVTSVYYPELFMYFPAALMLCGASLQYAMHAFIIAINAATALIMRVSAGRLFKNSHAGMISAVLYTLSAYRLTDLYTRFSIGEVLAMAFVPLFIWALYEVVAGDKRKWKLLAVSAMCIYQSHLISTVICALVAVAVCALLCVRIVRERRIGALILAAVCALGLCLYALVPMITYNAQGVSTAMMVRDTSRHLLAPAQLLLGVEAASPAPADGSLKYFALVIGLPLVIGAAAALHSVATAEKRTHEDIVVLLLLTAGTGFAFMTTTLCPWGLLERLTGYMAAYIQFPWRLLMMTSVCFAMAGGFGLAQMAQREQPIVQLAALALCAAMVTPLLTEETRKDNFVEAGRVPAWDMLYEDYTLEGTVVRDTKDKTVHAQEGVLVTDYEKFGTRISAHVQSEAGGEVSFPLFAFEGYEASVGGESIPIARGENNRITLALPQGTDGELLIRFVGKPIWRAAEAVSLLTAALMLAHTAWAKKRRGTVR